MGGSVFLSFLLIGGERLHSASTHDAVDLATRTPSSLQNAAPTTQPVSNQPMATDAVSSASVQAQTPVQDLELMHDVTPASPQESPASTFDEAQTAAAHLSPISAPVVKPSRLLWMQVTAYCPCKICCGPKARGITASGRNISYNGGRFVAADTALLPFGTQIQIPGYARGEAVEVIDRGSAIRGNHLDVYFSTHEQAKAWGTRWIAVTVLGK